MKANINQAIVDAVKAEIDFTENAGVDIGSDIYLQHMPEGLTEESVRAHRQYDTDFAVSASEAASQAAIEAVKNGCEHDNLLVGVSMLDNVAVSNGFCKDAGNSDTPWTMSTVIESPYEGEALFQEIFERSQDALNNL